jgi:multicomponent Na+:H+ antiporter subunit A
MLFKPSLALLLSVVALVGGFLLWRGRGVFDSIARSVRVPSWATGDRAFDTLLNGTLKAARFQTDVLQNGSLRNYMRVTLIAATGLTGLALLRMESPPIAEGSLGGSTIIDWLFAGIIAAGAIGTLFQRKALAAIAVMGTVGFVGAVVFLVYGAPDVAMTQLATETLIVIIFVLVIYHLPKFSTVTSLRSRVIDGAIAVSVGVVMTVLTIQAAGIEAPSPLISEFYAAQSYDAAYGRNVVNVILVDFRGFDTLGEIFVLGASAVGLFTLLRPPARIREARA